MSFFRKDGVDVDGDPLKGDISFLPRIEGFIKCSSDDDVFISPDSNKIFLCLCFFLLSQLVSNVLEDFLQDRALQLMVFVPPRVLYCNDISVLIPGFVDSGAAPDNRICTIRSKGTRRDESLVANLELVLNFRSNEDALDGGIPSELLFVRTLNQVKEGCDIVDALDNHNRDGKQKRSEIK